MAIGAAIPRNDYLGNGVVSEYDYTFFIRQESHLSVVKYVRATGVETPLVLNADYTVVGVGEPSGGSITLLAGTLPITHGIVILGARPLSQDYNISGSTGRQSIEDSDDDIVRMQQQLDEKFTRSLALPKSIRIQDFNPSLPPVPVAGNVLAVNAAADAFEYQETVAGPKGDQGDQGAPGFGVPVGGTTGQVLSKIDATDLNVEWKDSSGGLSTPIAPGDAYKVAQVNLLETDLELSAPITYSGISALTGANFTSAGIKETLDKIIRITYTAPTVSLTATGSGTLRERGDTITNPTLSASVTKRSDPIASVSFYADSISGPNQVGTTQTSGGGIPGGGVSTQATSVSFSSNKTFYSRTTDSGASGGPTNVDSAVTFSFVYPYYYGAAAGAVSAASVAALAKQIISETTNTTRTFSVTAGQVVYFAYPAAYGNLVSILDVNNFETIGDWTKRVENITGLDGNPVSYHIYEFKNTIGVTGSYQYTFKQ